MGRPRGVKAATGHVMTVEDWKALYLVWQLARQICLHGNGRKAIKVFATAVLAAPTEGEKDG